MKRALLLPVAALSLLPGCKVGPDFQLPGLAGGTRWKQSSGQEAVRLPDAWWTLFRDAELNQLVSRALVANHDLAAAKARLDTSRALVGVDRARLFPTLNLSGSGGISRQSADAMGANLPPGFSIPLEHQRYRSTFNLAYDPDLWGRNRRVLESSVAQAAANAALLDAQRLGIAAEVSRQYFLLRGLDAQEGILRETLASRNQTLDLLKSRADAGLADDIASSRARTEIELAKNDLASVQRQRGSAEHALAVLCGSPPSDFSVSARKSSRPFPTIKPGLPAEVLARRPDVRASEQSLRSANAGIGIAQAAFYPNISLVAEGGFESLDVRRFLNWENRVLALGANLSAPIFNAGSNQANYRAARSRYDEALANHRQTLLIALREVEDALVDLKALQTSRRALESALMSAKDTKRLTAERFEKGLTSYLDVVDTDRTILQIRLALSQLDAQQRITLAALAKALGGGWVTK